MKYLTVLCITLASMLCFTNADRHWKCGCSCDFYPEPVGDQKNPGFSCKDILENNEAARNYDGIYWITLSDPQEAFPVYCDMAGGGWTMVFKAVSGCDEIAHEIYTSSETYAEYEMDALDVTNRYTNDYKNRIVLNWCRFGASEARVVLYEGEDPVKEMIFNAKESDNEHWFQFDKLTSEIPWADMNDQPQNRFAIKERFKRSFIINSEYGRCPKDIGWMVISGGGCPWERHFGRDSILYSKLTGRTNWNVYENVGVADTLVVFLR
ncbi:uncharacterized protein LOC110056128 [Orbicella faveolata]|uniref:uncharacterized protein LOC110056128 n=1 Tax=Orbicella faveolata TaxID=48498 RepID=UPI0009E407C5|nr:uncharacterized protein LOC110056128 [Orbicella faveolata]XP_020618231.1 uncharacterized protein LOC110056128 [Orbicella faveolata]XP_020618232.1 uncharacterized protein LOC110056128 [Orbicella faveolata]